VVVHANRPPGAYWISVRGTGVCTFVGAYQVAVLRYAGVGSVLPNTPNPRRMGIPTGVVTVFILHRYSRPKKLCAHYTLRNNVDIVDFRGTSS